MDVRKIIFLSNHIIHMLLIFDIIRSYCSRNLFIIVYFCAVSLLPDLLGSLHQEI